MHSAGTEQAPEAGIAASGINQPARAKPVAARCAHENTVPAGAARHRVPDTALQAAASAAICSSLSLSPRWPWPSWSDRYALRVAGAAGAIPSATPFWRIDRPTAAGQPPPVSPTRWKSGRWPGLCGGAEARGHYIYSAYGSNYPQLAAILRAAGAGRGRYPLCRVCNRTRQRADRVQPLAQLYSQIFDGVCSAPCPTATRWPL